MCRAIAIMWIGQFEEAPIAPATATAFSNASRVMMSDGLRFSSIICTIRLPVSKANQPRSRYGAGTDAQPGNDMPSASASEFIESAVPIELQCPAEGADEATFSMNVA